MSEYLDEFGRYNPAVIGIVLAIDPIILPAIKKELVEAIKEMDGDDRCYLYHPDNTEMPRWTGETIGKIANYKQPRNMNIGDAVQQVSDVLSFEDDDARKYGFVFYDYYDVNFDFRLKRALKSTDVDFAFYNLDRDVLSVEESIFLEHIAGLSDYILKTYKGDNYGKK